MPKLVLEYIPSIAGGKTRKITFYDCHVIFNHQGFKNQSEQPMQETIVITAGGVQDSASAAEYSTYWRKTFGQTEASSSEEKSKSEQPKELKVKAKLS
ncbi:type VI secretion system tube protein TssD [Fulvivirga maritima]|uniref:type VI secretion system tube protein TssD n=1 Tax=Fulvivirga maritima TaxID=2904247 RepID=UPI00351F6B7B